MADLRTSLSVWTRLYVGAECVAVDRVEGTFRDISGFRKIVKREWSNRLQHVDSSDLRVYSNERVRSNGQPLEVDYAMAGIITSVRDPIIVVAPVASAPAAASGVQHIPSVARSGFAWSCGTKFVILCSD